jgi:hypothetical protein
MIELLNIDCMEYMAACKDKEFDLAIVDPPYGINAANMTMGSNPKRKGRDGRGELQYGSISVAQKLKKERLNGGGGYFKGRNLTTMNCDWDMHPPTQEYFSELRRVSKNQIIWGGNYFVLPPTRCMLCWDKMQPWDNFSQFELAWTSFDSPAKLKRLSNRGGQTMKIKYTLLKSQFHFTSGYCFIMQNLQTRSLTHILAAGVLLLLPMHSGVILSGAKLIYSISNQQGTGSVKQPCKNNYSIMYPQNNPLTQNNVPTK